MADWDGRVRPRPRTRADRPGGRWLVAAARQCFNGAPADSNPELFDASAAVLVRSRGAAVVRRSARMGCPMTVLGLCRWAVAFVWIFQGLVPKLLGPHVDELAMAGVLGLGPLVTPWVSRAAGVGEIAFGLVVWLAYRKRWVWQLTLLAMAAAQLFTTLATPRLLVAAFNSTTIDVALAALAAIALIELRRSPPESAA